MTAELPLKGIRVLEFSHAVMGPTAGLVLADLGADVIRVEPSPAGDATRRLGGFGSGYFTYFNRNKKSVVIDLKSNEGAEAVHRLVPHADVVIENFGPGVMGRLHCDYEVIAALNPAIVYCALKGFLPGPYASRPALDETVQMLSGLAYMTGPPGHPLRAGASVVDILGGVFGALSILAALRVRAQTGRGQFVETGLFETAVFLMGQHMAYAALTETAVPPMPARSSAWAVYQLFDTADGQQVFVGVTSDQQWQRFCSAFDRPDLGRDPRLATNEDRIHARSWLIGDLQQLIGSLDAEHVIARCEDAQIPYAPVRRPEDLFEDRHLEISGGLVEVRLPDGRTARLPRLPFTLDGSRFDLRAQAPAAGAHTREVLTEFGGYAASELDRLHRLNIIVCAGT